MRIDCHVHVTALQPGRGRLSPRILKSVQFRVMQWMFGLDASAPDVDARLEKMLIDQLNACEELDAAAVFAFDSVYDANGRRDEANTHFAVENDYVIDLSRKHPKVLFGCSVHPYRPDAIAELERCVSAGAVLCKWLPITQGIDPSDRKCFEFYDALAHHKLPLLSHTGGEKMLPNLNNFADPTLLLPAIRRGVTVIGAHCGTRSSPGGNDYLQAFVRMLLEHEHFYGDTSALNLPMRWHAYEPILTDARVMQKVIHGSDWPVIPVPPPHRLGAGKTFEMLQESNWLRRDVLTKQHLGFDDSYWRRAANVLRVPIEKRVTRA